MAKEKGLPKPWSNDPVFQRTYFCNVRREDDKVTKWIRQNWSPEKIGWEDYEYAMVLARFLNWPQTLGSLNAQEFGLSNFKDIEEWLQGWADAGFQVWGNAYVITTHGIKMPKATYLCERVLPAAYELLGAGRWRGRYASTENRLAYAHEALMRLEGVGSFLGAQIIADLKNTEGHPLYEANDWYSWSAPGPGSLRGLAWFHGTAGSGQYERRIKEVATYLLDHDAEGVLLQGAEECINMQDLQNCLCEFDKYMRVKNGTGRSKRNYPGV